MTQPTIDEFEVEYARFNAQKTFSTDTTSQFEHACFGDLHVTRDPARSDAYYNRILGLTSHSVDQLDAAIAWIHEGTTAGSPTRVDVTVDHTGINTGINSCLTKRGFSNVDTLVWLHFDQADDQPGIGAPALDTNTVRELTTQDWPSIRRNREQEWPIEDLIWEQKRSYLCTETFRWFGIFDRDELVSTASTWTTPSSDTPQVTILGSAFTLPNYRNRGHQQLLLEARKQLVGGPLFVDVAPDSSSYRNCLRAGFADLDRRQMWTRDTSTPA